MSVIIKSLDSLPEHCFDCPCHNGESGYCQADKGHRYSDYRPFWCPLASVEVEDEINNRVISKDQYKANMVDILTDIRKKIENLSEETYVRNVNGCMDKKRPKTANEFKQSVLRLFDSYLNEERR